MPQGRLDHRVDGVDEPVPPAGGTLMIALIAAEAGVSVPTVSKVLNGPHCRRRGDARAGRAGHRPVPVPGLGAAARRPALGSSTSSSTSSTPRGPRRSSVLLEVAGPARVGVVRNCSAGAHRLRQEWPGRRARARRLARRHPRAVPTSTPRSAATRDPLWIPFVVVDTAGEQPPGVPVVGSANWAGRPRRDAPARARPPPASPVDGLVDVLCSARLHRRLPVRLDEAGIAGRPALIRYGDFFVNGGYRHGPETCCPGPIGPPRSSPGPSPRRLVSAPGLLCSACAVLRISIVARRPARHRVAWPRAHDRPPAAARDGRDRDPPRACPGPRRDPDQPAHDLRHRFPVVRESTAPPPVTVAGGPPA